MIKSTLDRNWAISLNKNQWASTNPNQWQSLGDTTFDSCPKKGEKDGKRMQKVKSICGKGKA